MNLQQFNRLHFIGIGGMGMRALAQILIAKGYEVSGSDLADSEALQHFRREGAHIFIGHRASNAQGADCVIISSAISDDNPELTEARKKGIPVFHRSDVLAAVLEWGKSIAVAGAHGKSTTSAMIGQVFTHAGMDPTVVLGGAADYLHGNSCLGKGHYVIAEADESDGSFLKFSPYLSVVTNIEDDHLDHYGTVENIKKAFVEFISHSGASGGAAIVCTDNQGIRDILPLIETQCITFGLNEEAEYRAENKRYEGRHMLFDVCHSGERLGTISLQVPGTHNMRDALAAVAAGLYCGIPFQAIAEALSLFKGVKRRFETKAELEGIWVVDDYAHHPTEIEATLKAAREMGTHRIVCAFQPHRYSRTKLLQDEFAVAFDDADILFLTDIYPAGEHPVPGVSGQLLAEKVQKHAPRQPVHYVKERHQLAEEVYRMLQPGDMFITMGAGSIYQTGEELISMIQEKGLFHDHKK